MLAEIYHSMKLIPTLVSVDLVKPHVPLVNLKLFVQNVYLAFIFIHSHCNVCPVVEYSQVTTFITNQGIYFVNHAHNTIVKFAQVIIVNSVIRPIS